MLFTHHLDIYKWKKNVQDPGLLVEKKKEHPQFWGCSGLAEGQRLKLQSWWENCILQLWMDSWSILPSLLIT